MVTLRELKAFADFQLPFGARSLSSGMPVGPGGIPLQVSNKVAAEIRRLLVAQFGADSVGDGVGVAAHQRFRFSFDHDLCQSFRAAVADDDAA